MKKNPITNERKQELEALAERLSKDWQKSQRRYRLYSFSVSVTLPETGSGEKSRIIDESRWDMPDFAAYRRFIVAAVEADKLYGVDDADAIQSEAETRDFPTTDAENNVLWDMLSARLLQDREELKPDAGERRRQRQGRVDAVKNGKHRQAKTNGEGKTFHDYRDRFVYWYGKRRTYRGAAVEVEKESGFSVDQIRKAAKRGGWV